MVTIALTSIAPRPLLFVLVPSKWIMVTKSGIILIDASTHEKTGSWSAAVVSGH